MDMIFVVLFFIGPESDHWECLSLTHSLTHYCLVNLIDVTLACEDANSKLVEVVTVADQDRVGNNLSVPALRAARMEQPAVAEMPTHSFVQPATRLKL